MPGKYYPDIGKHQHEEHKMSIQSFSNLNLYKLSCHLLIYVSFPNIIPSLEPSPKSKCRILGYSLWLVPPKSHIQYAVLNNLITEKVPQTLSSEEDYPVFFPHVTLTSAIPKEVVGDDPEAWLEKLELLDANEVEVKYKGVDVGNRFFKKAFIRYDCLIRLYSRLNR